MRIFSSLYRLVMQWSRHRHAPIYLFSMSFAESSFFPVPPDAMLAPMALAKPKRAWQFALLATVGSVLGGMLGYLIGALFLELVQPWILQFGYEPAYLKVVAWFGIYGFWAVFVAGFSPVPYKLFTIGAGAVGMPFLPFVFASIISRGARFFLVSFLMSLGGERFEKLLHRYIDVVGWIVLILAIVGYFIWHSTLP